MCKWPEVETCLGCSRNSKDAHVAERSRKEGEQYEMRTVIFECRMEHSVQEFAGVTGKTKFTESQEEVRVGFEYRSDMI